MASKTTEIESQNFENGRPVSQCYSMLPHRSLGFRVFGEEVYWIPGSGGFRLAYHRFKNKLKARPLRVWKLVGVKAGDFLYHQHCKPMQQRRRMGFSIFNLRAACAPSRCPHVNGDRDCSCCERLCLGRAHWFDNVFFIPRR